MIKEHPSAPVIAEADPLNARNVQSAPAYWADEAGVRLAGGAWGILDFYPGKPQVRLLLKCLVARKSEGQVKVIKVQRNTVATRTETCSDWIGRSGFDRPGSTEACIVDRDRITSPMSAISPPASARCLPNTKGGNDSLQKEGSMGCISESAQRANDEECVLLGKERQDENNKISFAADCDRSTRLHGRTRERQLNAHRRQRH